MQVGLHISKGDLFEILHRVKDSLDVFSHIRKTAEAIAI